MWGLLASIDKSLEPLFKNLPNLPKNGREGLANALPWIALVFGVLEAFALFGLLQLALWSNQVVNYANQAAYLSGQTPAVVSVGFVYWLAIAVLAVDALILLMAFGPLRSRKARGWKLLFLGVMLNLAYGVVSAFDVTYGGVNNLLSSLVSTAVGLYLLYQVKSLYGAGAKTATHEASAAKK